MRNTGQLRNEDLGAALMAWYAEAVRRHPEGLVTQAQAARMLGVSRMAVSRLLAAGHLRAVHFPKPPDIAGVSVGRDDADWVRLAGWLGVDPGGGDVTAFPKACYVSFGDVVRLWQTGEARRRCRCDWAAILAGIGPTAEAVSTPPQSVPSAADEPHPPRQTPEPRRPDELETWLL